MSVSPHEYLYELGENDSYLVTIHPEKGTLDTVYSSEYGAYEEWPELCFFDWKLRWDAD